MKISIYGLGNFGFAILKHFDNQPEKNIEICAYDRNKKLVKNLKEKQKHLFFHKSVKISKKIKFVNNVKDLMSDCDVLILAVNSDSTREILQKLKTHIRNNLIIVNTAKALDFKTGKRLSEIIESELKNAKFHYALLAGGTLAVDLFNHQPLGVDIACEEKQILPKLVRLFQAPNLRVYPTTDLRGVEYASAFKNIISIIAGIVNGMKFSYGSETHLISRLAYEIERFIIKELGGRPRTFSMKSQCWSNDLWMSSTGKSRSREFGRLLGGKITVNRTILKMKQERKTIEGLKTLESLRHLPNIRKYPLINFLYELVILKSKKVEDLEKIIYATNNRKYR